MCSAPLLTAGIKGSEPNPALCSEAKECFQQLPPALGRADPLPEQFPAGAEVSEDLLLSVKKKKNKAT